jgi:hypothetical protein
MPVALGKQRKRSLESALGFLVRQFDLDRISEISRRTTAMTTRMVDDEDSVIRLARVTKTILPIRHAPWHAIVEIFMSATELEQESVC